MKYLQDLCTLAVAALLHVPSSYAKADENVDALTQKYREERILDYHSDIQVKADASMEVTETIKIVALGDNIKHGIYRDFPTEYRTRWRLRKTVGFHILEVQKDGRLEAYHTESVGSGTRIYIGQSDEEIPSGVYTYRLRYETDRQLGFFPDHDELYWNVTGNGWNFPIDKASATVILPAGVSRDRMQVEGYTGPAGSKDRNLTASAEMGGRAVFETTEPLGPQEGLTVVVTWPKGLVLEPTQDERWIDLLKDNRMFVFSLFGLIAILAYYLVVWFLVGRDPEKGTIIPLYEAPDNLSPGAARYIWKMGYDDKVLAADLIHLGVLKRLKISDEKGTYVLEKLTNISESSGPPAPEEEKLLDDLFDSSKRLEIKQSHRATLVAAVEGLKSGFKKRFEKIYFRTNLGWFAGGLVVTLLALFVSVAAGDASAIATGGFMGIWLTGWSFGTYFLVLRTIQAWRSAFYSRGVLDKSFSFAGALFASLFALPFLLGELFGIYMFGQGTSVWMLAFLLLAVFLNLLFFHLLKAPTLGGRKVLDKIEGLRMYLGVAEKDRLNALTPPKKTPEIFEKFLPYALALDVEEKWAEQFSDVLAESDKPISESTYSPAWYSGATGLAAGAFAGSLAGSLASSIASASVSPSSSSGSGGGGSSGGGGGGGGGGGW
jgi:uncharacterized membrane protein YgcG